MKRIWSLLLIITYCWFNKKIGGVTNVLVKHICGSHVGDRLKHKTENHKQSIKEEIKMESRVLEDQQRRGQEGNHGKIRQTGNRKKYIDKEDTCKE